MSRKIISLALILLTLDCFSQGNSEQAESILQNFYNWYIEAVKERRTSDIYPQFIKSETGFTTLYFSTYLSNLGKANFSKELLQEVMEAFEQCESNLSKLKYEDFIKLGDLDDFEEMDCAFNNVYTWIWSMEPVDGIEITEVASKNESEYLINFKFYYFGSSEEDKSYNNLSRTATLKLFENNWQITSLK